MADVNDPEQTESVLDLFRDISKAKARMSMNNPHREVFVRCEAALWHLSKELHDLKQGTHEQASDANAAAV